MKFSAASFLLIAPTVVAFQAPRLHASTPRSLASTIGGNEAEGKPAAPMSPPSSKTSTPQSSVNSPPPSTTSSMPTSLQEVKLPDMMSSIDLDSMKEKLPDMSNLMASLQPDDGRKLGERGEIYVAGQVVLMLAILAGGGIPLLGDALSLLGPVLLLAGLAGIVLSVTDLGTSISPFTTPNPNGKGVQTQGIYQYVRHPMYTTLLASCVGWSLVTDSATRLILTALLVGVLNLKTDQEEQAMLAEFPEEYAKYQENVKGKFFPLELIEEAKSKVTKKN